MQVEGNLQLLPHTAQLGLQIPQPKAGHIVGAGSSGVHRWALPAASADVSMRAAVSTRWCCLPKIQLARGGAPTADGVKTRPCSFALR